MLFAVFLIKHEPPNILVMVSGDERGISFLFQ